VLICCPAAAASADLGDQFGRQLPLIEAARARRSKLDCHAWGMPAAGLHGTGTVEH
jgi:hypothetical protein